MANLKRYGKKSATRSTIGVYGNVTFQGNSLGQISINFEGENADFILTLSINEARVLHNVIQELLIRRIEAGK